MLKLAANLSMQFNEYAFLERFSAAADAGFKGVEYLHPYGESVSAVAEAVESNELTQVLFNFPPGDWDSGDRGIAGLPDRVSEFRDSVERAVEYAIATGCKKLHAMAGVVADSTDVQGHLDTYAENVRYIADAVAPHGIEIMLEVINSRVDIPGYIIDTTSKVLAVLNAVDRSNVRIQFDIYHMQIMEGDLARSIEQLLPHIGHMQLADNPGRHEPGTGEIDYPWLLARIDELGYDGWIGCEYKPSASTVDSLGWAAEYL
jgi:hydroxypyruvate isomerase